MQRAAEDFEADTDIPVDVDISRSGLGLDRFCEGELDIANASRPIDEDEAAACAEARVEYQEPDSKVNNWQEVDPTFPDVPLKLFGADPDSGTFRYFTFVINGERGASRTDYDPAEDDNDTVEGIADRKGALGYLGFSYYQENRDLLSALEIDGGNGCVAPSNGPCTTAPTSRSHGRSSST